MARRGPLALLALLAPCAHALRTPALPAAAAAAPLARVSDRARTTLADELARLDGGASLVVMSLPLKRAFPPCKFVNYTQTLTRGLQRVILVRGSGREVVTTYA